MKKFLAGILLTLSLCGAAGRAKVVENTAEKVGFVKDRIVEITGSEDLKPTSGLSELLRNILSGV